MFNKFLLLSGAILMLVWACAGVESKLTCTTNEECFEGYLCDAGKSNVCLPGCGTDLKTCNPPQFCDIPTGDTQGVCRIAESDGGDSDAGDSVID